MFRLADMTEAITGQRLESPLGVITDAVIDSRRVIPGSAFFAMPGSRVDGHDFVADAFQRGASVAVIQRPLDLDCPVIDLRQAFFPQDYQDLDLPLCLRVDDTMLALQSMARFWRSQLPDLRVVGITGSVGKSTTKEAIADVLASRYRTIRSQGNLNNEIGLPLSMLRVTPAHQYAVLEMGFYVPGEIALLCDIARPQIGVINNIGTVHAERAGTQETIAQGKSELVQALGPQDWAVLNQDDPWVRWMAERTQARVFWYGMTPEATLWADEVDSQGLEGIRLRLHYQGESLVVRVPMIGRHSVQTVLRAAAVGLIAGLTWDEIINGLQSGQTQLRMVVVRSRTGALILDDTYNATPESTLAALSLLSELPGRHIAVLGDMLELGRYERDGHEKVGLHAAQTADWLITVGPRSQVIAETAIYAGMPVARVHSVENSQAALSMLQTLVSSDDAILIKGSRSMAMESIVEALEYAE